MKATELNHLKAFLSEQRKVVITTHKGPDGDAMGSSQYYTITFLKRSFGTRHYA